MKAKTLLNVRVKPEMIEELNKLSDHLDRPYSQIIREAITDKLNELKSKDPSIKKILTKPEVV